MTEDTAQAEERAEERVEAPAATEPVVDALTAHLAGVEHDPAGASTLWLSDEGTTMYFPLTPATVPALMAQLREVDRGYANAAYVSGEPMEPEPPDADPTVVEEEPGRLSRWTGWHYSNSLVRQIPPRQRLALFAAVLVILLLITLLTGR